MIRAFRGLGLGQAAMRYRDQEALDVGAALRHPVLAIFGMKPGELRLSNRLVETMLDKLLAGFTLPHTKSTVLQDWMKGRRSEVDDLNGLVVAKVARLGRMAPVNTAIAEMAHRVEQGKIKPALANRYALQDLIQRRVTGCESAPSPQVR